MAFLPAGPRQPGGAERRGRDTRARGRAQGKRGPRGVYSPPESPQTAQGPFSVADRTSRVAEKVSRALETGRALSKRTRRFKLLEAVSDRWQTFFSNGPGSCLGIRVDELQVGGVTIKGYDQVAPAEEAAARLRNCDVLRLSSNDRERKIVRPSSGVDTRPAGNGPPTPHAPRARARACRNGRGPFRV